MITPVLNPISISKDAKTITLADATGAYDVSLNPGGYGTPNFTGPPTRVGFTVRFWTDTVPFANKVIEDGSFITALLSDDGAPVTYITLGLPTGYFSSGIQHFKYYPFETINTVLSLTKNSKLATVLSGTAPDTFNAAYKAICLVDGGDNLHSNVILIDRTQAITSTTFYMDTAWTGDDTTMNMMISTEGDRKVLFTQMGEACIVSKIGYSAEKVRCDDKEIVKMMELVRWKLAAEIKYQKRDYDSAHKLMVAMEKECMACVVVQCSTCR